MSGALDPAHERAAAGSIARARTLKSRADLARLDFLRAVAAVASHGLSPSEIIRRLGVNPPEADAIIREAASVAPLPSGFHGADPCEIVARFAAGAIDGDTAAAELANWPYDLHMPTDSILWSTYEPVGFEELQEVLDEDVHGDGEGL